ncbi:MAG: hypothetical protein EOO13_09105 [Chitinophagaceae bacterium]|nr:MAG: hypothetical protein EOO13_09105 [Chitinophagaceae bacterium]
MKRPKATSVLCIIIPLMMVSLFTMGQQYNVGLQQNTVCGQLSKAQYDSIRSVLQAYQYLPLKDTLIIKYQYESTLMVPVASENDDLIQQSITEELRMLHGAQIHRKNISLLNLMEPGGRADTLAKYNNLANVDEAGVVHRMILNENKNFNSVILFPNRKYICINSADGWAALKLKSGELQQVLSATARQVSKN